VIISPACKSWVGSGGGDWCIPGGEGRNWSDSSEGCGDEVAIVGLAIFGIPEQVN
jgi:hypothetical protein